MNQHASEVAAGERFEFGKNWDRFLSVLSGERVAEAEASLKQMLECDSLMGKRFLDVGSGSGLFSLAARRLGAVVHSFDFDPRSVACTSELKRRYFPGDDDWQIGEGSVLDAEFVKSLGVFDIVYSWGVLHHTGEMWKALDHAQISVAKGGRLFIAIYNDQDGRSRMWRRIKRTYCSGAVGKLAMIAVVFPILFLTGLVHDLFAKRNPLVRYRDYRKNRGMSAFYDWHDWLGGYPYEVAKPEQIFEFYKARGFHLLMLKTTTGLGNNEFVFKREAV